MYSAMMFTNPWASMYFVFLMVIGTYVMMNLFIAILLNNLEIAEAEEGSPRRLSFVHSVGSFFCVYVSAHVTVTC